MLPKALLPPQRGYSSGSELPAEDTGVQLTELHHHHWSQQAVQQHQRLGAEWPAKCHAGGGGGWDIVAYSGPQGGGVGGGTTVHKSASGQLQQRRFSGCGSQAGDDWGDDQPAHISSCVSPV